MTINEALKILDPETTMGCLRAAYGPDTAHMIIEANRMAIAALRAEQEREGRPTTHVARENQQPLTWDELLAMEGEPVWIVEPDTGVRYWAIMAGKCTTIKGYPAARLCSQRNGDDYGSAAVYGKMWLAYRYPPKKEWRVRECGEHGN